jgi:sulfate adenylyltransferase subunit 1 (EFTu-like GTPase family)
MATGASTCNLAVILIDARRGVQTQTRRHSFIVSLLGIKHVIVAINKMDLVEHSQEVYDRIREEYLAFSEHLTIPDIRFVPISALRGDNVVTRSENMGWYQGATLMELLEACRSATTWRWKPSACRCSTSTARIWISAASAAPWWLVK